MGVTRVDGNRVSAETVDTLGLDPTVVGLMSKEGLVASLRRAASFLCPATPGAIVRTVAEALSGLPDFTEDTRNELEELVDALIGYGDVLELDVELDGARRRQLFLGPPLYVRRSTKLCLLIGIRPDGAMLLSDELHERISHEGHVRSISLEDDEAESQVLESEGLVEISREQWLKMPRRCEPGELIRAYGAQLDAARSFEGGVEGVRIIDPSQSVSYYRGRWRAPKKGDDGRFVGRRPQAFGADLWCFVEIRDGGVRRLIDLPVLSSISPAADEAWRLQAAIDAEAGHAQVVEVRDGATPDKAVVDFFSPVPTWAQRGLDLVGTPVNRTRGSLFSYSVPTSELDEELSAVRSMMWLRLAEDWRTRE